jgi:hypothetical protein
MERAMGGYRMFVVVVGIFRPAAFFVFYRELAMPWGQNEWTRKLTAARTMAISIRSLATAAPMAPVFQILEAVANP